MRDKNLNLLSTNTINDGLISKATTALLSLNSNLEISSTENVSLPLSFGTSNSIVNDFIPQLNQFQQEMKNEFYIMMTIENEKFNQEFSLIRHKYLEDIKNNKELLDKEKNECRKQCIGQQEQ